VQKSPHFWHLLTENPDAGVLQKPTGPYALGSRDEALLIVGYIYAVWYETPGAVDMLRVLGRRRRSRKVRWLAGQSVLENVTANV
jgi:hypothetical protein